MLYLNGADSRAYHANIISTKYSMGSPIIFYCSHNAPAKDYDWYVYIRDKVDADAWVVVIKIRN